MKTLACLFWTIVMVGAPGVARATPGVAADVDWAFAALPVEPLAAAAAPRPALMLPPPVVQPGCVGGVCPRGAVVVPQRAPARRWWGR